MAQPVYSLRIFATGGLTPGAGVVGPIVPAGFVYVLRDIDMFEETAAGSTILTVRNQTGGVLIQVQAGTTISSRNWEWRGRQVYNEGEQVAFLAVVGQWSVAASGYQLTLP